MNLGWFSLPSYPPLWMNSSFSVPLNSIVYIRFLNQNSCRSHNVVGGINTLFISLAEWMFKIRCLSPISVMIAVEIPRSRCEWSTIASVTPLTSATEIGTWCVILKQERLKRRGWEGQLRGDLLEQLPPIRLLNYTGGPWGSIPINRSPALF